MSSYQYPYLSPHQSRTQEPTQWQNDLASAIESIFSKGATTLDEVVEGLNASRVRPHDGSQWTTESYITLMRDLGK